MSSNLLSKLLGKTLPKKDPDDNIVGECVITHVRDVENATAVALTLDNNDTSIYFMSYKEAVRLADEE